MTNTINFEDRKKMNNTIPFIETSFELKIKDTGIFGDTILKFLDVIRKEFEAVEITKIEEVNIKSYNIKKRNYLKNTELHLNENGKFDYIKNDLPKLDNYKLGFYHTYKITCIIPLDSISMTISDDFIEKIENDNYDISSVTQDDIMSEIIFHPSLVHNYKFNIESGEMIKSKGYDKNILQSLSKLSINEIFNLLDDYNPYYIYTVLIYLGKLIFPHGAEPSLKIIDNPNSSNKTKGFVITTNSEYKHIVLIDNFMNKIISTKQKTDSGKNNMIQFVKNT